MQSSYRNLTHGIRKIRSLTNNINNNNDDDDDDDDDDDNNNTVEPLLSGHPLLGGQLSKSQNYSQHNTVNKIFIKRPPLLSGRGHLLAVPIRLLVLFLPLFSGQQEGKVRSLSRGQPPLDR